MTLATAYFLGLKRTYRLALKIEKRLIGPKHPKLHQFVHRRVRSAFDVAVRVHKSIQQRDIEVGRNLGNKILRWLDRWKPSAEIRGPHDGLASKVNTSSNIANHIKNSSQQTQQVSTKLSERDSNGKVFFSPLNMRARSFRNIAMMMQPMRPAGMNTQYRQFYHFAPAAPMNTQFRQLCHFASVAPAPSYRMCRREGGVFRKDIAQLMLRN